MTDSSELFPTKLRIRTASELDEQARGLVTFSQGLEFLGIPYFLEGGTLLGAVRNRDFIPWDWDVGLCARMEDIEGKVSELVLWLTDQGFECRLGSERSLKINALKNGVKYELAAWGRRGKYRVRRGWRMPARFFEGQSLVELRGTHYPALSPPVEVLQFWYGDWQTPRREADTWSNQPRSRWAIVKRSLRFICARTVRCHRTL